MQCFKIVRHIGPQIGMVLSLGVGTEDAWKMGFDSNGFPFSCSKKGSRRSRIYNTVVEMKTGWEEAHEKRERTLNELSLMRRAF